MKFTLSYLSDLPGSKTLCIHAEDSQAKPRRGRSIQVTRFFLGEPVLASRTMITVVVRGAELQLPVIERLVTDYLLRSRDYGNIFHLDMSELKAPVF